MAEVRTAVVRCDVVFIEFTNANLEWYTDRHDRVAAVVVQAELKGTLCPPQLVAREDALACAVGSACDGVGLDMVVDGDADVGGGDVPSVFRGRGPAALRAETSHFT